jgi:maleylacetate reductase
MRDDILSMTHHWPAQQRVHPNADLSKTLADEVASAGARRVFLLSTRSLRDSPLLARTREAIGERLCGTYDTMRAHTPAEDVAEAASQVLDSGVDLVVALGGGSVIDGGKAVCFAAWNRLTTAQALLDALPRDVQNSEWDGTPPTPRLIAIPTTLSAAEFTGKAGVKDMQRGRKARVMDAYTVPKVVILDPSATLHTPAELLLSSAVRSVDHAVERWCSNRPMPFSDAVSLQAMQMLAGALPEIRRNPDSLQARAAAQYASWLSIMGEWADVPVGASHGIGYILGAYKGLPHGMTSCVMLHAVLRWNEPATTQRQARIAEIFGAASASDGVRRFVEDLGLPTRLSHFDITPDQFPDIAARYDGRQPPISTNPRPIRGSEDLVEILSLAA